MEIPVISMAGTEVDKVELPAEIFEVEVKVGLMHQAYVRQMANARLGTHKTQSRGEVNRSKSKWYRHKGTGRARHGSRNAPIFVGGGVSAPGLLDAAWTHLKPGGRLVANAVTDPSRDALGTFQIKHGGELTTITVEGKAPITQYLGIKPVETHS